jgi:hypothetical protein
MGRYSIAGPVSADLLRTSCGIAAATELPAEINGTVFLGIAVQDLAAEGTGSLEIPVAVPKDCRRRG